MSNLHIKKLFYKRGLVKVKTVNKVMIPTTMRVKIGIANDRRWGGGLGRSDGVPTPIRHPYTLIHDPNRPSWSSRSSLPPPFERRCRHPDRARPSSDRGLSVDPVLPSHRQFLAIYIYIYQWCPSSGTFFFASFWTKFYT